MKHKMKTVKAYKGFDENLECRDFQYEIGKTYTIEGGPIPCAYGFHACEHLDDIFNYYNPLDGKIRICEVELTGECRIVDSVLRIL